MVDAGTEGTKAVTGVYAWWAYTLAIVAIAGLVAGLLTMLTWQGRRIFNEDKEQ
jgi:hypothetical protein